MSLLQYCLYCPRICLQQFVLHLDVSVQQKPVLCQKMAYSSLWCTWTVCLQEPVLHRDVSVYKSFCVHLRCLSTIQSLCCTSSSPSIRAFCCTWKCLSSRALLHLCISVYQSFVLHLCLSAVSKSSVFHLDVFGLQESSVGYNWRSTVYKIFLIVLVFFETGLFVWVVSIRVQNTETSRK